MPLDMNGAGGWIAAAAAISGMVIGWSGHSRAVRKDDQQEAGTDAVLRADMEYIKRGVDDIRLEQRNLGQKNDAHAERLTRVEESAKQAHHRLNRLEGSKKEDG